MVIRDAQKQALMQQAERAFTTRLRIYLLNLIDIEDQALPVELLEQLLSRGRAYGLAWESSLTLFVTLALEIGLSFDEWPRFKSILQDRSLDPEERITRLIATAEESDWQHAAQE
jgi:hypothetical protein